MTGIVIDYDERRSAASVLIEGAGETETAYKVRVDDKPLIGDEIVFAEGDIVHHFN